MKSAKKTPLESDEPGPWRHAARPKLEAFGKWELYGLARASWEWPSAYSWQCRTCSHEIYHHYRGLCDQCNHACDGADALHDELLPLVKDAERIFARFAKLRQGRR